MTGTPTATPLTAGRVFDSDWTIANVARLLRANAGRGVWRSDSATSGSTRSVNHYYLRTVSARHLPTGVSLIFMRLAPENCWYASLCFAGADGFLPWNPEIAELWLAALFGEDRPRIHQSGGSNLDSRQFTLPC
jgi:hypothetical protein